MTNRPLTQRSAPNAGARTRAWRPFPREVADILCVEEGSADIQPRVLGRFAVTLVRSPEVVRLESSRTVVADRNSILLIPAWQLHALRSSGGPGRAPASLLFGAYHVRALRLSERPTLVADTELGAQVDSLVAQLRRTMRSIDCAITLRSLLERLVGRATPVAVASFRRDGVPLSTVRDHLRTHLAEQVSTAALARMSGLTECHVIRAFQQEFGLPPHAYHMRLRLAAACELLYDGLSVSTAAYECGFADQSHLSRKFKEVYGLTPAAWAAPVAYADTLRNDAPKQGAGNANFGVS